MITSKKTARRHIPAIYKKVLKINGWKKGTTNLDMGGGPYDEFTQTLKKHGVTNLVYDPFNRTPDHNGRVLVKVNDSGVETATLSNVLCVIRDKDTRQILLGVCAACAKTTYVTVYEGNKSGKGKQTRDGWQNNWKLAKYLPEVKQIFKNVTMKNGMIIASN